MIRLESHGDVTRVHMSSRVGRAIGYDVSAFVVRGVLIDAGFPDVGREFAAFLDAHRPEGMILTHHHEDHAGNIELTARGGLPVLAAPSTIEAVRAGKGIGVYRRVVWGRPTPFTSVLTPYASDTLALVPTPGHSYDHHAVWDRETGTLFGGDLFLGVKVRLAHHDENPRQLVDSLRTAARLAPERMFDAHRGLVEQPVQALIAKADWLAEMIARIEARIAEGWSDRPITRDVFGREGLEHYVSFGDLSRVNFVRHVRETKPPNSSG